MRTKFTLFGCILGLFSLGLASCGEEETAKIELKSITLSSLPSSMAVGESQTITATPVPADAEDVTFAWTAEPAGVLSISGSGATVTVSAVAVGSAKVVVSSGTVKAETSAVSVVEAEVPLTGIQAPDAVELTVGGDTVITVVPVPDNATGVVLAYSSADESIATVTPSVSGVSVTIHAVAAGETTVTVSSGNVVKTIAVTVVAEVSNLTGITLSKPGAHLLLAYINEWDEEVPAESVEVTATPVPEDATGLAYTWASEDDAVATVVGTGADATITAVAEGVTNIVVTSGEVVAKFAVTVTKLRLDWYSDLTFTDYGTYYELFTVNNTGTNDPYIYVSPLFDNLEGGEVFAFEYQSSAAISDMMIYYASPYFDPPIGPHYAEGETLDETGIDPADESKWKTYTLDLEWAIYDLYDEGSGYAGWGWANDYLRIDPGNEAGRTILIRNIRYE
jgi:uncharacterized protein YjdB